MRLSAKTFAAMLMGLALTAFQFDLDAQSRGGSRPSTSSAKPSDRPSDKRRPDMNPADRNPSKPSANRPAVNGPSGNRPSGNRPAVNRPSGNRPSPDRPAVRPDNRPGSKPAMRPNPKPDLRPAPGPRPPARPSRPRPPHVAPRPAIGSLIAANLIANTALTIARLAYYNNLNQPRARVARSLASQLGLVQSYADASTTYYYQDGVFYMIAPDGRYYVIVPPAGALVEELPYDYETVYINGNEYFRVDDTLYQYTILDGKPYFEVLGQLK